MIVFYLVDLYFISTNDIIITIFFRHGGYGRNITACIRFGDCLSHNYFSSISLAQGIP